MSISDDEVEAALDALVNGGAPVLDFLDFSASDAKEFGVLLPDGENFSAVDIVRHDQWRATGRVIIRAALSAAAKVRAIREGDGEWVMVPREPTEAMLEAGFDNCVADWPDDQCRNELPHIYRAMIATTPAATGGEKE